MIELCVVAAADVPLSKFEHFVRYLCIEWTFNLSTMQFGWVYFQMEYSINDELQWRAADKIKQCNQKPIGLLVGQKWIWWIIKSFGMLYAFARMRYIRWVYTVQSIAWKCILHKMALSLKLLLADCRLVCHWFTCLRIYEPSNLYKINAQSNHWIIKKEIYYWKCIHRSLMMTALPIR